MKFELIIKPSFWVVGKAGSTSDGNDFIAKLWQQADQNFNEIAHIIKRDDNNLPLGFWGIMTDMDYNFMPWEQNFSIGRYLAGAEVDEETPCPPNWHKWQVPGYEYMVIVNDGSISFIEVIDYLRSNNIPLVGAVHDYTCPSNQKDYMYFPIHKL